MEYPRKISVKKDKSLLSLYDDGTVQYIYNKVDIKSIYTCPLLIVYKELFLRICKS